MAMKTMLVGNKYPRVLDRKKSYRIRGGGFIGMHTLHSAVNLSHKSLSELLQLLKEDHSLALFSETKWLWYYVLEFTLDI